MEKKDEEREPPQVKTGLVRSKLTRGLGSSSGSIEALRACFESNVDPQNTVRAIKNSPASIKSADITHVNDREAEQRQNLKESPKNQTADASVKQGKDDPSTKVMQITHK